MLVASLLPDIIDKPLGLIILPTTLGSSRTVGHTLLFSAVLALLGLLLRKKRSDFRLLLIAYSSTVHVTLDGMWERPQVLLWPLFGFGFPQSDPTGWVQRVLAHAIAHPSVYIPEIAGFIICGFSVLHLLRKRTIGKFVRYGIVA